MQALVKSRTMATRAARSSACRSTPRNIDAAWIFMQWACSKDIMVRCTLGGGFAPMRLSSFADERVKAKQVVGPGTTRHLPVVSRPSTTT